MEPDQPIFLERESYRRWRIGDAAKLVPVVGIVIFLMPVLWAGNGSTSGGLLFLFGGWAILILVIAILSRRLSDTEPKRDRTEPGNDDAV